MLLKRNKTIRGRVHKVPIGLFMLLLPALFSHTLSGKQKDPIKWRLDTTVSNVDFYHSLIDCKGSKAVLLKFDNKNSYPVKISWKEKFTTQMETKAPGGKGLKEMTIVAGVTAPSACDDKNAALRSAVITPHDVQPHYVAEISAFEFSDVSVKKAN